MMNRLIVIAGPANSGKYPLAKKLLIEDPNRVLIHRDPIRAALHNKMDEWHITELMSTMARYILARTEHDVIVCAWNMEPEDRVVWETVAEYSEEPLTWLDTRDPSVQAMIPPMEATNAPQ